MRKTELDRWAWYPFKRLTEGKGVVGSTIRRIEEWNPFERIGNPESRKLTPLATIRQSINGENKEEKYAEGDDVRIAFEDLPKPIKNYAETEAQKTGISINEVLHSKPFKKYLLSKLK